MVNWRLGFFELLLECNSFAANRLSIWTWEDDGDIDQIDDLALNHYGKDEHGRPKNLSITINFKVPERKVILLNTPTIRLRSTPNQDPGFTT